MEQTKYDVFISYSRKDYVDEHENVIPNNEISKIMKSLTDAGITYWIDKEGIYFGDKFTEELPKIIKSAPIFVYLSTANANKSKFTSKEIAIADEYGKYIIPVRLDMTPYSDKVIFRIADISFIKYAVNPTKGREDLVNSIKTFLKKQKENELQKEEEERLRKEELERQRKQQEEEKKRQAEIERIEAEISAFESQKVEREKAVFQKEQELKLAQLDLKTCEAKILKLQAKLEEVRSFKKEKNKEEERIKAEENRIQEDGKRKEEAKQQEEMRRGNFTVNGVSFKMIRVEGGTFMMGSASEQGSEVNSDELPRHQVTLSDYYIGETQVTQALWEAVMGSNPSRFKGVNRPVENVSWDDCRAFIRHLNKLTGKRFRLPSEAEWEFAAHGGKKSKGYKYSGGNNLNDVAWFGDNSYGETKEVKTKSANELGLYDMSGNVWEWCNDWYGTYPSSPQTNPQGPSSGSNKVYRGGGWNFGATYCRTTNRDYYWPAYSFYYLGLRLAL